MTTAAFSPFGFLHASLTSFADGPGAPPGPSDPNLPQEPKPDDVPTPIDPDPYPKYEDEPPPRPIDCH